MTKFGRSPFDAAALHEEIRQAVLTYGEKPVADASGLARGSVRKIFSGGTVRTKIKYQEIRTGLDDLARRRLSIKSRPDD